MTAIIVIILVLAVTVFVIKNLMAEAIQITKGHHETWVKPVNPKTVFDKLKPYAVPYGFDFNNEEVLEKNRQNQ